VIIIKENSSAIFLIQSATVVPLTYSPAAQGKILTPTKHRWCKLDAHPEIDWRK